VFCNQKKIAGAELPFDGVREFLKDAVNGLSSRFTGCDIAFFGGSFTGIGKDKMIAYLKEANLYLGRGVTGIRLSTRPDYISDEILDILEEYGVTDIELGVQSLNDEVLKASKRGHTVEQTLNAVKLIKKRPFRLVLQLMPGLPGDTEETVISTFKKAAELSPDGVRIYPTVVIADTELESLYLNGRFIPLSVEQAVEYSAWAVKLFSSRNINILRIGLHSSDLSHNSGVVGGPYHPAFGELVMQRICLDEARKIFRELNPQKNSSYVIKTGRGGISRMTGQKRANVLALQDEFSVSITVTEDPDRDIKDEPCGKPILEIIKKR
jgi:histone acetyltransferase (RNA polymerase elongator complex component)